MNASTETIEFAPLPFLTEDVAPIAAAVKRRYEDFRVEEIPAYEPCGQGDHCFFTIEKRGIATMQAVADIARKLGVPARSIGLAGLKDARAVAVQTLSVEHFEPGRIEALQIPRIRVLRVTRHTNKLKIGHLRGNRFAIRLRDLDTARLGDLRAVCDTLSRRGVPNYFGRQRFGLRGDTWEIGRAVVHNDPAAAVELMLGRPGPHDDGDVLEARRLYESGDYEAAAGAWPYLFRENARLCRIMARTGGNHRRAYFAMDARLKKFAVNAYQSHIFNLVLARRVGEIDRIRLGDLAYRHEHGAVFRVEDEEAENERVEAFEISPTGPICGYKMTEASGEPGRIEQEVMAAEGVRLDRFRGLKGMKLHGARRPLRFRPEGLEIAPGDDERGAFVELRFALASGCYATMVLREICKEGLAEGAGADLDE